MSERGVFAVDRGIFTDPDFANEPFTEREAFMWLVSEAAWKAHAGRAYSGRVELKRGELCHSVRFMAEAWQWSKSRVDRFMKRLIKSKIISCENRDTSQVYFVCNYSKFQRAGLPVRDTSGTLAGQQRDTSGTLAGQTRNKETLKQEKEDSCVRDASAPESPKIPKSSEIDGAELKAEFEAWYRSYPHRIGKSAALQAYLAARKRGATAGDLSNGVFRYVASKPSDRNWCNPATWLNQDRWLDEPAPKASGQSPGPAPPKTKSAAHRLADRMQEFSGRKQPEAQSRERTIDGYAQRR